MTAILYQRFRQTTWLEALQHVFEYSEDKHSDDGLAITWWCVCHSQTATDSHLQVRDMFSMYHGTPCPHTSCVGHFAVPVCGR